MSAPPKWGSPRVASTWKSPSSARSTLTSVVPAPTSSTASTAPSGTLAPCCTAAATGSAMVRTDAASP